MAQGLPTLRALLVLPLLLALPARADGPTDAVELTVHREHYGDRCITGYLAVGGVPIVYTLERSWVGNLPSVSAVPSGTYHATLRYDHEDGWRLEMQDVKFRKNIQIHIGNWPKDSHGCVLVGTSVDPEKCEVLSSAVAYEKLKRAFHVAADNSVQGDRRIVVKFSGEKSAEPSHCKKGLDHCDKSSDCCSGCCNGYFNICGTPAPCAGNTGKRCCPI